MFHGALLAALGAPARYGAWVRAESDFAVDLFVAAEECYGVSGSCVAVYMDGEAGKAREAFPAASSSCASVYAGLVPTNCTGMLAGFVCERGAPMPNDRHWSWKCQHGTRPSGTAKCGAQEAYLLEFETFSPPAPLTW